MSLLNERLKDLTDAVANMLTAEEPDYAEYWAIEATKFDLYTILGD